MQTTYLFNDTLNDDERLAQGLRRTLLVLEFLDGAKMELDGEARWIDLSNEIQILNEILDCLDGEIDQPVTLQ
jgi:hypothetical protein